MRPEMEFLLILIVLLLALTVYLLIAVHREEKSPWHSIFRGDWKTAPLAAIFVELAFLITLVECASDAEMDTWAIVVSSVLLALATLLLRSRLIQIRRHALNNRRMVEQNRHLLTDKDRAELAAKKGKTS